MQGSKLGPYKLSQQAQSLWPVKLVLKIVFSIDKIILTLEQHDICSSIHKLSFRESLMLYDAFRDAV